MTSNNKYQVIFNAYITREHLFLLTVHLVDSTATSGMFSMNSGGGGGGGLFVGVVAIVAVVVGAVGLLLARKKGEHDGYEEILPKHKQTNNSLI